MRHLLVRFSFAALGMATTACGGGSGGGSPAAPSPTTMAIVISGYTGAITGPAPQTFPLTATASTSTGTTENVSSLATWTSDAPTVASVAAGGVVTTTGDGVATITAAYGGRIGSVIVAVNAPTRAVPTMTGSMAVDISPSWPLFRYRADLFLTFTETGGGSAYDVTEIQVKWSNDYLVDALWTFDAAQIAAQFGTNNTVPAGGTRTFVQAMDYFVESGMTAEVTARLRDSSGSTSIATGTYSGTLMARTALRK